VSTGLVALSGVSAAVVAAVPAGEEVVPPAADGRVVPVRFDPGGEALPPPEESTIAAITPPTAAAATAVASTAFFTGSEATLAPQCPHASRSS
jgi:hypothetical protein